MVGESSRVTEIETFDLCLKVVTLSCRKHRIPLAAKIIRINDHKPQCTMLSIEQA